MNTVTEETPTKQTRLNVGFEAHQGGHGAGEAWKRSIGNKGVPARLEMLPEGESRLGRVGVSLILQIAILGFFVAIPIFFPERLKAVLNQQVVPLAMPVTEIATPPPPPVVKAKVEPPKPAPVEIKLNPKQPHIFMQQKVLQPKIEKVEAKAPELTPAPVIQSQIVDQSNQPKRPREEVKMAMDTGSAATPTTTKLAPKDVQTGGFGDPNGLPGKGDPNKTTNVNRAGLQALPGGPGYGNGTGGDKGARAIVPSSGFGNGTAVQESGGSKRAVSMSGFANQTVAEATPTKKAVDSGTTPVELLEKPKPVYTEEGRSLKIEGDVALDVVFLANGTVQVTKVVSGLGHGLDEAATRAAQQIKFKPAKRDGENVDFPARIRIQFRLAY
jgi:TonB family protein